MDINTFFDGNTVSLEQMLEARDVRVEIQERLLHRYGLPIVCFTLNIAGPVKLFTLSRKAFDIGKESIKKQLEKNQNALVAFEEKISDTGCEAFFVVMGDSEKIKKQMVEIEDNHALGRFLDIDVILPSGQKVSRLGLGMEPRRCFICDNPASSCARSRNHSLEMLMRETISRLKGYFDDEYAHKIANLAQKSILYEVCVTPKPGLVDCSNQGAHKDMDIFTFMNSAAVLYQYFYRFTIHGLSDESHNPETLFSSARYLGIEAEEAMFESTQGINTHKGIIFSLGLICIAMGYLCKWNITGSLENLMELCSQMASCALKNDFKELSQKLVKTKGENIYALYGITGVRGEAASGFLSVIKSGLPLMRKLIDRGFSLNDAGVATIINLIANVEDTNIIGRSSPETLKTLRGEIFELTGGKEPEDWDIKGISERLDKLFIQLNISPGGCADLLAITFMLYFLFDSPYSHHISSPSVS